MKKALAMLLAALMLVGASGCSKKPTSSSQNPNSSGSQATTVDQKWYDEEGNIHVYASSTQTITSLDWMDCNDGQAFQIIYFMTHTPLIGTDHEGHYGSEYGVGAAESYEFTEDGKEWTFHIRKGMTFNNGEVCDANDVVATLQRCLDYKGQKANLGGVWPYLEKVEKVDDYTVKAYFSETYATPLKNFAQMFILSDTDYAELGDNYFYQGHLFGTGPWQYEDYMDGQFITLSRRNDYWGECDSNVDKFTLYFITEENAVVNGLTSSTLDFVPRLSMDLMSLVEADPDLHQDSGNTYWAYALIGLQCGEQSAFHDPNLRKAFAYCIDRQTIADTIMGGGVALQAWLPEGTLGSDPSLVPIYDVELAKQYVAQSDYDGREIVLFANSPVTNSENIATAICDYARVVGINMKVQVTEQAYTTEVRKTGEYDAYLVTNSSTGDEGPYTITRLQDPGANHNFRNERLDELMPILDNTVDPGERDVIMKEMNKIIYDNCVLVSLFTMDYHYVARNGLEGFRIVPSGYCYTSNIHVS